MKGLIQFLSRNPLGVSASLLLIGSTVAGDLNGPGVIGFLLMVAGVVMFFAQFLWAIGPWLSKKISYGEALTNALGPMMLVWIIAVLIRGCILGLLGKPL